MVGPSLFSLDFRSDNETFNNKCWNISFIYRCVQIQANYPQCKMKYVVSYVTVTETPLRQPTRRGSVWGLSAFPLYAQLPPTSLFLIPASHPAPLYLPIFYWLPPLAVAVIPFLLILATPSHLPKHPLLPLINNHRGWATGRNTNTVRAEPCYKKSSVSYEKNKHFENQICLSPKYNQQVQQASLAPLAHTYVHSYVFWMQQHPRRKRHSFPLPLLCARTHCYQAHKHTNTLIHLLTMMNARWLGVERYLWADADADQCAALQVTVT